MRLLEGWGGTVARARRDGARPRVARVRTSASPIPQGLRKSNREARAATSKRAPCASKLVVKAATRGLSILDTRGHMPFAVFTARLPTPQSPATPGPDDSARVSVLYALRKHTRSFLFMAAPLVPRLTWCHMLNTAFVTRLYSPAQRRPQVERNEALQRTHRVLTPQLH